MIQPIGSLGCRKADGSKAVVAPGDDRPFSQRGECTEDDLVTTWKRSPYRWQAGLAVGLAIGLVFCGLWPNAPLHAVCTDRSESFAMATGPVDTEVEAVYFLDLLTGDLKALVLGKMPGTFSGFFQTNVGQDLGVDPTKSPKFMMVTGLANIRRAGGRQQYGIGCCYVAEVSSGKVAAYAIPWEPSFHASNRVQQGPLTLMGTMSFRNFTDLAPPPGEGRGRRAP